MKKKIVVDVAIATRYEHLIIPCLESLFSNGQGGEAYELNVIVICKGPEVLYRRLREDYPAIKVIQDSEDKSLANSLNSVLRGSLADYILMVNDDIVFLPDSVMRAISFMEQPENARIGMLSIKLLNQDGTLQPSTYSFPSVPRALLSISGVRDLIPLSHAMFKLASVLGIGSGKSRFWFHDRTCEVDTFRGAYMLARGDAVREVGLIDEVGAASGEDVEWHYRFWQKGWKVVFYHKAAVIHLGGQTVRTLSLQANNYFIGFLNFFKKHRRKVIFYSFCFFSFWIFIVKYLIAIACNKPNMKRLSQKGLQTILEWI